MAKAERKVARESDIQEGESASTRWRKRKREQGRYAIVSLRLCHDAKFLELSGPPPNAKDLFQYLLYCPERSVIPGLIRINMGQISSALGWPISAHAPWPEEHLAAFERHYGKAVVKAFQQSFRKGVREVVREVEGKGMLKADWKAGLVWLPNALRHDLPGNPNVVVGWGHTLRNELPDCELKREAIIRIAEIVLSEVRAKTAFLAAFEKCLPGITKQLPESLLKGFVKGFQQSFPKGFPKSLPPTHDPLPMIHKEAFSPPGHEPIFDRRGAPSSPPNPPSGGAGEGEVGDDGGKKRELSQEYPDDCFEMTMRVREAKTPLVRMRVKPDWWDAWHAAKLKQYGPHHADAYGLFLEDEAFAHNRWKLVVFKEDEVCDSRFEEALELQKLRELG